MLRRSFAENGMKRRKRSYLLSAHEPRSVDVRTSERPAFGRYLVEGLELVRLHRRLVLVQVAERVLRAVVVRVVVGVDRLRLEAGDGIELLDRRGTEPSERTEDCTLDLRNLGVLDGVDEGVLRVRRVVLQLLRRVLLAERCNLVEVHLEVVRHLLRQSILRSRVLVQLDRSADREKPKSAHRCGEAGELLPSDWCHVL